LYKVNAVVGDGGQFFLLTPHARRVSLPTGRQARTMKMVLGLGSYALRHALCAMLFYS
jgi:hypothetical protein